ncbi:MAG: DNA translocase FtsK [Anaerolineae bacterium]|nr:DNA translocase FtsK [Anaerolineae bacterium]
MTKRQSAKKSQPAYRMARPQGNSAPQRRGQTKTTPGKATPSQASPAVPERRIGPALSAAVRSATGQQLLALALILFGFVTIVTLAGINTGALITGWSRLLVLIFGWGAYITSGLIVCLGLLWLRHLVHRPTAWRWRPLLGFELAFFGLLALSHIFVRQFGWDAVLSGQGGGLIGWALSFSFIYYSNILVTVFLMGLLILVGIGLVFDVTLGDLRGLGERMATAWKAYQENRAAEREEAKDAAARTAEKEVARRAEGSLLGTGVAVSPTPQRAVRKPSSPPPSPPVAPVEEPAKPKLSLPPLTLLQPARAPSMSQVEIDRKSRIIEQTLAQFGVPARVTEVRQGPTVTQFGVTPGFVARGQDGEDQRKVRVSQISALADDLKLALAARSLRVEAPVPGRAVVGIEVPNEETGLVTLRRVLESQEYARCNKALCFAVGLDVAGTAVGANLSTMPHLLVAGTTGSGKSVFVKAVAASLIMRNTPTELKLVAIDPKMVELSHLNGLPHLLGKAETELERILRVLRWVTLEMEDRYKRFASVPARNLEDYNRHAERQGLEPLARIVVLVDELADLMMAAPDETERSLTRIAQMARATGIHLVVATQRPSTDVVTGLIKANFPARVSFAVASNVDSRVILDTPGAESLLGQGDMLFLAPDAAAPRRIQGCYISDEELEALIHFWQRQVGATPSQAPWETVAESASPEQWRIEGETEDADLLEKAIALAQQQGNISTSAIQRRLRISYPRAARLMEQMEAMGIVGPQAAAGRKRQVILGDDGEGED